MIIAKTLATLHTHTHTHTHTLCTLINKKYIKHRKNTIFYVYF